MDGSFRALVNSRLRSWAKLAKSEVSVSPSVSSHRDAEIVVGTTNEKMMVIEECANSKAVTILIRGGNKVLIDEAERCGVISVCVV